MMSEDDIEFNENVEHEEDIPVIRNIFDILRSPFLEEDL